ncbi:F0F1 ATP synthase subunit B [Clostridiaceae bacterium M8S5]|nr:F0F1 ATP synthase subunit B [Clostridiaceae bacterium M8S5]
MPTVHVLPDPVNFLLQILATIVLFGVLRYKLYEPVTKMLEGRKDAIAKDIKLAEDQKTEAQKLRKSYEVKISEAKNEAKDIIEASRKRGDQLREEIVTNAKKDANDILEKANKEIDRQKEKAAEELKTEIVSIAMMAASKVVEEKLDEKTHKNMINKFINEVGESKWHN